MSFHPHETTWLPLDHICEILCWWWGMLLKSVIKIQIWLKPDENNGHFIWSPRYVYDWLLSLPWVLCIAVDIKLHYFFMQFTWWVIKEDKMWNSKDIWYLLCLRIWNVTCGFIINVCTNCVWNIVFMAAITNYFMRWWRNNVMYD